MNQLRLFRNSLGFSWLVILILLVTTVITVHGQDEYREFYTESLRTTNTGMYVLGGWAITNMAIGAYGWSSFDGDTKFFHQMNLIWNTVNLSIAGYALYSNYILDITAMGADEIMDKHTGTERILLINTALNVGYIGTGFLMRHLSGRSEKHSELLKGYGNSVILQGSFLFLFDLVLYGILRSQRYDFMESVNLAIIPDGAAVRLIIPL